MSDVERVSASGAGQGVGARMPRKEDDRFLRGRGQYVADIRLAGLQDVAFVRSQMAHAKLRGVTIPDRYKKRVFTHADLGTVQIVQAGPELSNFRQSPYPALTSDKVR